MRTKWGKLFIGYSVAVVIFLLSSCSNPVNTVYDPHFTEDGYCLDSPKENFVAEATEALDFYVEVSGSIHECIRASEASRLEKAEW